MKKDRSNNFDIDLEFSAMRKSTHVMNFTQKSLTQTDITFTSWPTPNTRSLQEDPCLPLMYQFHRFTPYQAPSPPCHLCYPHHNLCTDLSQHKSRFTYSFARSIGSNTNRLHTPSVCKAALSAPIAGDGYTTLASAGDVEKSCSARQTL